LDDRVREFQQLERLHPEVGRAPLLVMRHRDDLRQLPTCCIVPGADGWSDEGARSGGCHARCDVRVWRDVVGSMPTGCFPASVGRGPPELLRQVRSGSVVVRDSGPVIR
jgi:hypothetical protein